MGTLIEKIRAIINPSCLGLDCATNTNIPIEENDVSAILKKVIISDMTSKMLLFYPDRGTIILNKDNKPILTCMSPLLSRTKDTPHNKACDAVIIYNEKSYECKIIYVELKSNRTSGADKQFQSTLCFIKYLEAVLEHLYNVNIKIIESRYIVLCGRKPLSMTKFSTLPLACNNPADPQIRFVQNNQIIPILHLLR